MSVSFAVFSQYSMLAIVLFLLSILIEESLTTVITSFLAFMLSALTTHFTISGDVVGFQYAPLGYFWGFFTILCFAVMLMATKGYILEKKQLNLSEIYEVD